MADLSASPEPRPMYQHKTWTRSGYHPHSQAESPPKQPRAVRHSLPSSQSRSGAEPALLLRMDLRPGPSKPGPADHQSQRKPFSKRKAMGTAEGAGENGLTLGNHRVGTFSDREVATRRNSMDGTTTYEGKDNMGISTPRGRNKAVSGHDRRRSPRVYDPIISGSPRGGPFDGGSEMQRHGAPLAEETGQRNHQQLESSWSHLPLKDRITPIIVQNANLRLSHDQQERSNGRYAPPLDDRNVDAVITPDFCDSIANSLEMSAIQLAQEQRQHRTPSPSTEQRIRSRIRNPTQIEPRVENMRLDLPTPSVESSTHSVAYGDTFSQQRTSDGTQRETLPLRFREITSSSASHSNQVQLESPTIPPGDAHHQTAIPIPIHSSFFNPQPSSSSSRTFHEHQNHDNRTDDHYESMRHTSPSPNTRPHKRLRLQSPSPTSPSHIDKNRSNLRTRSSLSPPPHHLKGSPSSPSYPRFHKSTHPSHRSRSPRSQTSRSSSSREPGSPRRRETGYLDSGGRRASTTIRRGLSPTYPSKSQPASDYSRSHHSARVNSDVRTYKSPYQKYSASRPTKEPYLTAFEREQLREKSKRDEQKERADRPSHTREEHRVERWEGRLSTTQMAADDNTANVTGPAILTSLPTPPTSAVSASYSDSITLQQTNGRGRVDGDDSAKVAVDSVQFSSQITQNLAVTQAEEVPGLTLKESHTTSPEEVLLSWRPFGDVPGIWFLKNGSDKPDVFEYSFEITKEFAIKWNLPPLARNGEVVPENSRDLSPAHTASWKLKCVPTKIVDPIRQTLENPVTAKNLVQKLIQFQSVWPPEGKLIIEVNTDHVLGKTLYPKHLDSGIPFVELKYHIHGGRNFIRFIQLGDISEYVFILYTTSPPELLLEDTALSWDRLASDHELSLDILQYMLQKTRLETSTQPLFRAQSDSTTVT